MEDPGNPPGAIARIPGVAGCAIDGALLRVNATIASGKSPKIRITAADAQTTVRVQAPVRAGTRAAVARGFMNMTITTYK